MWEFLLITAIFYVVVFIAGSNRGTQNTISLNIALFFLKLYRLVFNFIFVCTVL